MFLNQIMMIFDTWDKAIEAEFSESGTSEERFERKCRNMSLDKGE